MRKEFSEYLLKHSLENKKFIFLTGDLGYNAFESLKELIGPRFINTGVAEQNMISMAAGLAYKGFQVMCYSIAPFIVYRALEQIRNDVCFHNLPVSIVGNGGGYGYGIMGSTHHTLEDVGILSSLPNMTCYVPAFIDDLFDSLDLITKKNTPAYLRMGIGKKAPSTLKKYNSGYYQLENNTPILIITQGPVTNQLFEIIEKISDRVNFISINQMPFHTWPDILLPYISHTKHIITIEEHILNGGLCAKIGYLIASENKAISLTGLFAKGYPDNLYGSQNYHLVQNGLNANSILQLIETICSQIK